MSDPTPPSMNGSTITRAGVAGLVLAGGLIGLFFLIWIVMGELGAADFPRLVAAVCIPPGLISIVIGFYLVNFRQSSARSTPERPPLLDDDETAGG